MPRNYRMSYLLSTFETLVSCGRLILIKIYALMLPGSRKTRYDDMLPISDTMMQYVMIIHIFFLFHVIQGSFKEVVSNWC